MDNKKIIMLIIPNLGSGGAQKVFREQLAFLSTRFIVIPVVFNWDGAFEEDHKLGVVSLDVPAGTSMMSKAKFFLRRIKILKALKKKYNVTISISHLEGADYVNLFSRQQEKVICWIHGTKKFDANISSTLGSIRMRLLIPQVYRRADRVVTVSKGIQDELNREFGVPLEKLEVIYNGFDLEGIKRNALEPVDENFRLLAEHNVVFVTHCRLSRQKNLDSMLRLFGEIPSREKLKLVIIGDGELRQELLDDAESFGLSTYNVWSGNEWHENYDVYFLGFRKNSNPFLKASAAYIMTSSWEGFPLSLCEAMACGLVVFAADCPTGPSEIIAPARKDLTPVAAPLKTEFGVLMPMLNDDAHYTSWIDIINSFRSNPAVFDMIKGPAAERIRAFDQEIIQKKWLKLLE